MSFLFKNRLSTTVQNLFFIANILSLTTIIASEKSHQSSIRPLSKKDRINLCDGPLNYDGSVKYPSIEILEKQLKGQRLGVCHNYAFSEKLDLKGQIPVTLPIVGQDDWHYALKFTEKYCEEVSIPQAGDFVTYYADNDIFIPTESIGNDGTIDIVTKDHKTYSTILHTGLVHSDGMVKSKWGRYPEVVLHPTFHTPESYGRHVKYFRLTQPVHKVIEDIKKTISQCNYNEVCTEYNNELVKYAEESDNENIWDIWQRCMCTNVEASNEEDQSLLMIGAKKNNYLLVKTAIQHGANIKKQDKNGQTALDLAKKNNNLNIVNKLEKQEIKILRNKWPFTYNTAKRLTRNPIFEESLWQL
ncbi:MAG TPA: ankyrin repeat domain-containing protein [Candidatus Babeliales bacterium]|nr:ankyrin repeat domain-containing protein [Candidatus Babeliales bacterium]